MDILDKINKGIEKLEKRSFEEEAIQQEQDKIISKNKRIALRKDKGLISAQNYEELMLKLAARIDEILLQKGTKIEGGNIKISAYRLLIRNNEIDKLLNQLFNENFKNAELRSSLLETREKYERLRKSELLGVVSLDQFENQIENILEELNVVFRKMKNNP